MTSATADGRGHAAGDSIEMGGRTWLADASQVARDTSSTQEAAAMSTGKEMVSDANRRDCSARAERRVTGACEVAEASEGARDAAALAGEVVSASLVQGEGAFSAGKERSSESNRRDCSAKAEGRAAHAREVAGQRTQRGPTERAQGPIQHSPQQ